MHKDSQVNKDAQKERHFKLFFRKEDHKVLQFIYRCYLFLKNVIRGNIFLKLKKKVLFITQEEEIVIYYRVLFKRMVGLITIFFVINSFNISSAYNFEPQNVGYWSFGDDLNDSEAFLGVIRDEEGYLLKSVPTIKEGATYLNRQEVIVRHEVQEFETLSQIAEKYGLEIKTLLWANNIIDPDKLRAGTKLKIPKTDGVVHIVKKDENINQIATQYKVDVGNIRKYNNLINDIIQVDQVLIIPGGKPIIKKSPQYIAVETKGSVKKSQPVPKSEAKISGGGKMTFPTVGKITQGYKRSHLGIDIGNRSSPGIWAARSGKVIRAEPTGWNGGYGKMIVIDHGKGIQTLYAHLSQLYVSVGQSVDEGQVIGKMGNSGRVYGPTGIHLHFEVHINGRKVSPWNYL